MVLKGAGLEQALSGAAMAAEADFEVRVKEFRGEGEPVYSIVAYARPQQVVAGVAGPDPKAEQQSVFSLNELTGAQPFDVEPFSVETILGALRLATEGEQNPPRIRFHEDSGLLLVRGTQAQIGVVQLTLSTMRNDLSERQRRHSSLEQQRRQREAQEAVKNVTQDR
jgi:hypothetical protein